MSGEPSAALDQPHVQRPLIVAACMFALLAALNYTEFPSLLPGYPAVIVTFFLWGVLPGWFIQQALLTSDTRNLVEQICLAFLVSVALAAVPGLIGLRLHWSIETFGLCFAGLAALATGVALLWSPEAPAPHRLEGTDDLASFPSRALLLLILVPLLAVATSPWWEDGRIARDADDLVMTAFVRDYSTTDLNASRPFLDRARGAYGRMQLNVWVVDEALLVDDAGVAPLDLTEQYLPPLMVLLVVGSTFTLARGLFKNDQIALLACAFLLMYGALDLTSHDGFGRNLFLRAGQDKMVASFTLLPLSLLLASSYLARPSPPRIIGMLLTIAALTVTHPMSLMLFGATVLVLVVLRLFTSRPPNSIVQFGTLVGATGIAGIGMFIASKLGTGQIRATVEPFRRSFHITDLPWNLLVGNYHLILHPFVLLSILVAPLLWFFHRRGLGSQVLLSATAASLAITFVPPVSTAVAKIVNEEGVWRAPWLIPIPVILAYGLHRFLARLEQAGEHGERITGFVGSAAAIVAIGVIGLASLLILEQYVVLDDGQFYNRTSSTELLPWTGSSIFLGGVERAFSSDWRPTRLEQGVLDYLSDNAEPNTIVLQDPHISTRFYPAVLGDMQIGYNGAPNIAERRAVKSGFFGGQLKGQALLGALRQFGVDYAIVASRSAAEENIQNVGATRLGVTDRIALLTAGDFERRGGSPTLVEDQERAAWTLSPSERDQVTSLTSVTIPDGVSHGVIEFVVELETTVAAPEDASARLVVTLDPAGSDAEPIHTVLDLSIEAGTAANTSLMRVRSPVVPFEEGHTYNIWIWRDGQHKVDTYAGDILFRSVDVRWFPDGPPLGNAAYYIYRIDTETER